MEMRVWPTRVYEPNRTDNPRCDHHRMPPVGGGEERVGDGFKNNKFRSVKASESVCVCVEYDVLYRWKYARLKMGYLFSVILCLEQVLLFRIFFICIISKSNCC